MGGRKGHGPFFDVWSRFYDRTPFLRWALWSVQDAAIDLLAPRAGDRILDLGCGPGRGTKELLGRGAKAVAADYSEGMARSALEALGPGSAVVRLDAPALPFADGSFDGLLCTNSFHHYPQAVACLREMRRVLRPGGRLVLADPLGGSWATWLIIGVGERILFGLGDVHVHDEADWAAMCREAGFRDVRAERGRGLSPAKRHEVFVRAVA